MRKKCCGSCLMISIPCANNQALYSAAYSAWRLEQSMLATEGGRYRRGRVGDAFAIAGRKPLPFPLTRCSAAACAVAALAAWPPAPPPMLPPLPCGSAAAGSCWLSSACILDSAERRYSSLEHTASSATFGTARCTLAPPHSGHMLPDAARQLAHSVWPHGWHISGAVMTCRHAIHVHCGTSDASACASRATTALSSLSRSMRMAGVAAGAVAATAVSVGAAAWFCTASVM
mmetsp:Transcript_3663/g.10298  ORF Transcript_3663/g.10298 Transcript_3663/m.10298 type:complete len:231 (-) Transcript_3663:548-1240(-)